MGWSSITPICSRGSGRGKRILLVGIRLDWEVESEHAHQRATEDPAERSRRRFERLRVLMFTSGVLVAMCTVPAPIWFRLRTVDGQQKRDLTPVFQAVAPPVPCNIHPRFLST